MRSFLLCCAIILLCTGCKKEGDVSVEIYLLKSFSQTINASTNPATVSFTNAVLADTPLVADGDIAYYQKATTTFGLKKDINTVIKNFGPDKAFAVTVNKSPIYFGQFHPAILSSIAFGVATIDPMFGGNKELQIQFATVTGSTALQQLDKRNDSRLIDALEKTERLR